MNTQETEVGLRAFAMDDEGALYAAHSPEEAAKAYADDCGEQCDAGYPRELSDAELDADQPEFDEDEQPTVNVTSVRAWIAETTEPGWLAGGHW